MTLKDQIRAALGLETQTTKLAYQDKLVDGTIITSEADELAAGIKIDVLTEDGTTIPLPVGVYEIAESGVKFEVTEEGIVAEVMEAEEEEAEADDLGYDDKEEMSEETVENTTEPTPKKIKETREVEFNKEAIIAELSEAVKDILADMQKEINELKEIALSNNTTLEEEVVTLTKQNKDLNANIETLKKEPAADPIKINKFTQGRTEFKELSRAKYNKLSVQEKFLYNKNRINNINKK